MKNNKKQTMITRLGILKTKNPIFVLMAILTLSITTIQTTYGNLNHNLSMAPPTLTTPQDGDTVQLPVTLTGTEWTDVTIEIYEDNIFEKPDNIDLDGYTLVPGYPKTVLNPNIELSGIGWNPNIPDSLFMIDDSEVIYVTDLEGGNVREIMLSGFDDTEDIVHISNDIFAIVEEKRHRVSYVEITSNTNIISKNDVIKFFQLSDLNLTDPNNGLEGIAYDFINNILYSISEKDPLNWYGWSAVTSGTIMDPLIGITPTNFGITDQSSLYYLGQAQGLDNLNVKDHFLLLSDESHKIIETDTSFTNFGSLTLPEFNGTKKTKFEGITMDNQGNIYLVSEPNLLYKYSNKNCNRSLIPTGALVHSEDINENSYTVPANVLEAEKTYSWRVTTPDGQCSDFRSFITAPDCSIMVSDDTNICKGDNTQLEGSGTPGSTFSWSPTEGLDCTNCPLGCANCPNPIATPTITTTYTLTVSNNDCSATAQTTVTVIPVPAAVISVNDVPQEMISICPNQEETLVASGGENYLWNTGETSPSITVSPDVETTYTVIVNNGECTDTAQIIVSVSESSAPIAIDDTYTLPQDGSPVSGNVLDNDTNNDSNVTINTTPVTSPVNGIVDINSDGTFTYTPNTEGNADSFEYEVCTDACNDNTILPPKITFVGQVNNGADDIEQGQDGRMYTRSSDLELIYDTYNDLFEQTVGIRIANIEIPQGAIITKAHLQFVSDNENNDFNITGSPTFTIAAHNTGNAGAFNMSNNTLTNLPKTNAEVTWNAKAWATNNTAYNSADISEVIKEITSRSDWQNGNAMSFIITAPAGQEIGRRAHSFNGKPVDAPKLIVEYQISGQKSFVGQVNNGADDIEQAQDGRMYTTSSDLELIYETFNDFFEQTVGIRITNIEVPKGATITDAHLQFVSDNEGNNFNTTGSPTFTIAAHNTGNAGVFNMSNNSLTNLPKTNTTATWNPEAWTTNNTAYTTADISEVIKEIISRSDWQSGNAMSFIITAPAGQQIGRRAHSYDGNSFDAPKLFIKYKLDNSLIDPLCNTAQVTIEKNPTTDKLELLTETHPMRLYPVPASEYLNIDYYSRQETTVRFDIISNDGRVVMTRSESIQTDINTVRFDIAELPAGYYYVRTVKPNYKPQMKTFVKIVN